MMNPALVTTRGMEEVNCKKWIHQVRLAKNNRGIMSINDEQ